MRRWLGEILTVPAMLQRSIHSRTGTRGALTGNMGTGSGASPRCMYSCHLLQVYRNAHSHLTELAEIYSQADGPPDVRSR